MRKICSLFICIVALLSLACCANPTSSTLAVKQLKRLEEKFNDAMNEEDFLWDESPRYVPSILVNNESFRMKVSFDPIESKKGIHFDLESPAPPF